jgi:selenide,water dikinase
MADLEVHACTDISGFGLLGHALEVAAASQVTLEIEPERVRFLDGAVEYARAGAIPGGLKNNRDYAGSCVSLEISFDREIQDLLYDPQTSGGLLISLSIEAASLLQERFPDCYAIGRVVARKEKPIHLV